MLLVLILISCNGITAPEGPEVAPDVAESVITATDTAITPVIEELLNELDYSEKIYTDQEVWDADFINCCIATRAISSQSIDYDICFTFSEIDLTTDTYGFVSGTLTAEIDSAATEAVDDYYELILYYSDTGDFQELYIRTGIETDNIYIEVNGHDMSESLGEQGISILSTYKQTIESYIELTN